MVFLAIRPDEKTASFKVNTEKNLWHDFGLSSTFAHLKQGNGGSIIDLWCDYHIRDRRNCAGEALQALRELYSITPIERTIIKPKSPPPTAPRYKITKIADRITFNGLRDELDRRKISLRLANQYLKQGFILDTDSGYKYTGFLFENDLGGYEVSIPNPAKNECFKICIGKKAVSRFLVDDSVNSADIFEGFWDFLTWLELKGSVKPINHTYILNSTSMVKEVCEKIIAFKDSIKYAFLFMDNDDAGYLAAHSIAANLEPEEFKVGGMEYLYDGYKDLSDKRVNKPLIF